MRGVVPLVLACAGCDLVFELKGPTADGSCAIVPELGNFNELADLGVPINMVDTHIMRIPPFSSQYLAILRFPSLGCETGGGFFIVDVDDLAFSYRFVPVDLPGIPLAIHHDAGLSTNESLFVLAADDAGAHVISFVLGDELLNEPGPPITRDLLSPSLRGSLGPGFLESSSTFLDAEDTLLVGRTAGVVRAPLGAAPNFQSEQPFADAADVLGIGVALRGGGLDVDAVVIATTKNVLWYRQEGGEPPDLTTPVPRLNGPMSAPVPPIAFGRFEDDDDIVDVVHVTRQHGIVVSQSFGVTQTALEPLEYVPLVVAAAPGSNGFVNDVYVVGDDLLLRHFGEMDASPTLTAPVQSSTPLATMPIAIEAVSARRVIVFDGAKLECFETTPAIGRCQ